MWISDLILRHQPGAAGRKAVQSFGAHPLFFARLQVARRHVVHNRIAGDIIESVFGANGARFPADDESQLGFIVDALAGVRQLNRLARGDQRGDIL